MKKFLLASVCSALYATSSLAGGFQLSEYSTTQMGRAFAGYGIVGDDYSALAYNPAGMSLRDSGAQLGVSIVALNSKAEGTVVKDNHPIPGKVGKLQDHPLVPHIFAQYKLNDKARIGAGVYTPYGFQTNYSKYWMGRSHALKSKITVIDYNLSASYDITSNLSVGASLIAETLDATLTNNVDSAIMIGNAKSNIEGDSYTTVWNAGVLYRLNDDTRFGLSYHSQAIHKIKGKHNLKLGDLGLPGMNNMHGIASAKLVLPEYYMASAYHKVGKFGLSGSVKWTKWRKFKTLDIYSGAIHDTVGVVDENWRDTWMVSLGTDYYYNDDLTLRTGISFDQAGVRDAQHRTARVPDSDRVIVGVGASYKLNQKMQIDLGYAHVFMAAGKSTNQLPKDGSSMNVKYKSSINMAGISFQYNF